MIVRAALPLLLLLAACDPPREGTPPGQLPDAGETGVYIALQRDFADFRAWPSFTLEDPVVPAAHAPGPGRIFINAMPPAGAATFPVGTMIVKTIESGAPSEWAVHAMVKRGGGIGEPEGLPGWELFELRFDEDERPIILWRGPGPPTGLGYAAPFDGGVVELVCSDCHTAAWQNDSVLNEHTTLRP